MNASGHVSGCCCTGCEALNRQALALGQKLTALEAERDLLLKRSAGLEDELEDVAHWLSLPEPASERCCAARSRRLYAFLAARKKGKS